MDPEDPGFDVLARLERRTRALVAQRLRSVAAVIARLVELIDQVHALGHSHADVHARLRAGGLAVSWNNYRAGLARARRRQRAGPTGGARPAAPCRAPPSEVGAHAAPPSIGTPPGADSPLQLLNALDDAQRAAARDYAPAARAGLRKPRSSA